jgi:hypothetical protein
MAGVMQDIESSNKRIIMKKIKEKEKKCKHDDPARRQSNLKHGERPKGVARLTCGV